MPVLFSAVCELLEQSYNLSLAKKPVTQTVIAWFEKHRQVIDARNTDVAALLSTLLPEKRTDRVFCIKTPSLEKLIGRALFLGRSRIHELASYQRPEAKCDLADCVERILRATPNPRGLGNVTVEEIDEVLHGLAGKIKWSSPSIRAASTATTVRDRRDLEDVYQRLTAPEAKWFTRLILKSFQPLIFDPELLYRMCDPFLPIVLKVREDFAAALEVLRNMRSKLPPDATLEGHFRKQFVSQLSPQVGIKVGRQNWFKARSIKHCIRMGDGRMSVENKIDGEYCQIHIDLGKPRNIIQIFSKSGKDSTEDRNRLLPTIRDSLQLGRPDCTIKSRCILEGELAVYCDLKHAILPFYHIRKHVARRGRFMSTDQDSGPKSHEHLMIIYYDILLLDEQSFLGSRHSDRFKALSSTVRCVKGRAELVQRQVVDFNSSLGASTLRKAFANVIATKGEGLVLKPDDPYFNLGDPEKRQSGLCIKLKKEYIGNFGDVGDFAVVGGGYDPSKAKSYSVPNLEWTHFFLGCLHNKEEVRRWNTRPQFTVVKCVELNEGLMKTLLTHTDPDPIPIEQVDPADMRLPVGIRIEAGVKMKVAFRRPLVFDMRCFSLDKVGNTGFWTLRFPTVTKIHFDRDFLDTVTFDELQAISADAKRQSEAVDSQEDLRWIAKLEGADPRAIAVDARSQLTATTMPTPSPRRSTQPDSVPITMEAPQHGSPCTVRPAKNGTHFPLAFSQSCITPRSRAFSTSQTSTDGYLTKPTSPELSRKRGTKLDESLLQSKRRKPSADEVVSNSVAPTLASITMNSRALQEIKPNSQITASPPALLPPQRLPKLAEKGQAPTRSSPPAKRTPKSTHPRLRYAKSTSSLPAASRHDDGGNDLSSIHMKGILTELHRSANEPGISVAAPQTSCGLDGSSCVLRNIRLMTLLSIVPGSDAFKSAVATHGLSRIEIGVEAWNKEDESAACSDESESIDQSTKVLLIDSCGSKLQTKQILNEIETIRQRLPLNVRRWVAVYDLRILESLRVIEADEAAAGKETLVKAAWRRWYCGLV